ncbi:MAG: 50S ribosomal protein L31e [Candidatus Bathyarchaeia archaeon]
MSRRGEEAVEERIYTVPLGKAWGWGRTKRTARAMRILRDFIRRHMKAQEVIIGNDVNEEMWRRGIQKPPRKIRVKAEKDDEGRVIVSLAERGVDRGE